MKDAIKKRIILDCDPGVDDALAIIFSLKSPSIILDSITTVNGNTDIGQTTKNALSILEFMGQKSISVAKGASKPWFVNPVHSHYIFGEDGLGNISAQLPHTQKPSDQDAVAQILNRIAIGDIDAIVATGPLTNIADALIQDKKLMNSVKELIIMGGAVDVKGNITEFAEFNFFSDPHAADYVLQNATNVTLIPLDVTTQVRIFEEDLNCLKDSKIEKLLKQILATSFDFVVKRKESGVALHDPLTMGFMMARELFTIERLNIRVSLELNNIGECYTSSNIGPHIKYAKGIDVGGFRDLFIQTLYLI